MGDQVTSSERATAMVILVSVALLTLWDLAAVVCGAAGSSISEVMRRVAVGYPIVPFALAFLLGHVFIGGAGNVTLEHMQDMASRHLWAVLAVGMLMGAVLWPNR